MPPGNLAIHAGGAISSARGAEFAATNGHADVATPFEQAEARAQIWKEQLQLEELNADLQDLKGCNVVSASSGTRTRRQSLQPISKIDSEARFRSGERHHRESLRIRLNTAWLCPRG